MNRLLGTTLATLCLLFPVSGYATASSAIGRALPASAAAAAATVNAWGKAQQVPGLAALVTTGGDSGVTSVSCASPGECSAGGFYTTGPSSTLPFVVSQVHGTWQDALPVPGIGTQNKVNGSAQITSVSCASPGNCTAGGYYTSGFYPGGGAPEFSAFVVSQAGGTWGIAQEVPGIGALDTGGRAKLASVSCASPGNCGAAASRVLSQASGTWSAAMAVSVPVGRPFGKARITVVSCASAGDCAADGNGTRRAVAVIVNDKGGVWGTAREIAGTQGLMKGSGSLVTSIACASPGSCSAGGYAFKDVPAGSSTREYAVPYLVTEHGGAWGRAQKILGIGALSAYGYATITALSCATPRNCAAAGSYSTSSYNPDGSGPGQVFVLSKVNGSWSTPRDVTAALHNDGSAQIVEMACPAAGKCSAAGYYWLRFQEVAFVISQVR